MEEYTPHHVAYSYGIYLSHHYMTDSQQENDRNSQLTIKKKL